MVASRSILCLLRNQRGASSIEFAFIAPMLIVTAIAIADLSLGIARKFALEQASYRSLELVTVGSLQTDYQFVKPEAAAAADVPQSNVTVTNWLECNGSKKPDFSSTCSTTEETARFVRVEINGDYKPIFNYGPLSSAFGAHSGSVPLKSRSTIRIQ